MKARKFTLIALIAILLLSTMAVVKAMDAGSEDPAVASELNPDQAQADKNAATELAKDERKKAAKQKKRTMESCLTLVRSFYAG